MRAPPRWIPALAALIWAGWILYLGTDDRRGVVGVSAAVSEALQHIIAFAVLGALVMVTVRGRPRMVFCLVAAGGVLGEFAQLATSNRSFSLTDMAFSVIGAGLGVAVAAQWPDWRSTVAAVTIAGLLIAFAPFVLEMTVDEPITSFPGDCADPPPPVGGAPEEVLHADSDAGFRADFDADSGVTPPIRIDEPTTAALRARLLETAELSVAVEFSTTSLDQEGPVRLFTISEGPDVDQVNFHLGLEHDDLRVRLRTSCEIFNEITVPDVVGAGSRHRAVVTWGAGILDVWMDGVKVRSTSLAWGDLDRWDSSFPITIGSEARGGRRFDGSVYSVTMWDRALDDSSIVAQSG